MWSHTAPSEQSNCKLCWFMQTWKRMTQARPSLQRLQWGKLPIMGLGDGFIDRQSDEGCWCWHHLKGVYYVWVHKLAVVSSSSSSRQAYLSPYAGTVYMFHGEVWTSVDYCVNRVYYWRQKGCQWAIPIRCSLLIVAWFKFPGASELDLFLRTGPHLPFKILAFIQTCVFSTAW